MVLRFFNQNLNKSHGLILLVDWINSKLILFMLNLARKTNKLVFKLICLARLKFVIMFLNGLFVIRWILFGSAVELYFFKNFIFYFKKILN